MLYKVEYHPIKDILSLISIHTTIQFSRAGNNEWGVFWKDNTHFCSLKQLSKNTATISLMCGNQEYNVDLNGLELGQISNILMLKNTFESKNNGKKFNEINADTTIHFNVFKYDFNTANGQFDKKNLIDFYLSVKDVKSFEENKVLHIKTDNDNDNFVDVKTPTGQEKPKLTLMLFQDRFIDNDYFIYNNDDSLIYRYFELHTDQKYPNGKDSAQKTSSGGKCRKTKINTRIHYSKKKSKKTRRTKRTRQHREN
jgi:hypothetical protein